MYPAAGLGVVSLAICIVIQAVPSIKAIPLSCTSDHRVGLVQDRRASAIQSTIRRFEYPPHARPAFHTRPSPWVRFHA